MQATTTRLTYARNDYLKVGRSFVFDKVGDMIYYAAGILDKANAWTAANTFSLAITPAASDGAALGSATVMWSDLFLASGAVINFNNGDITLTHGTGKVTVASTWATAGATGRPWGIELTLNAKAGSYVNALKGYVSCGTGGGSAGLTSAVNCEIKMPNAAAMGAFFPLEIEYVDQASTSFGAPGSGSCAGFIYMAASGTVTDFDADGVFMKIDGLTAGAGKLLSADSQTLRCDFSTSNTTRYLLLSQAENGLQLGASGNPAGDLIVYGATSGNYMKFDQANDKLLLVGTAAEVFNVTSALTGTTAINGASMSFTAATTSSAMVSHGSSEGLYILQTVTGAKTGTSRTEALSVVQTASGSGASTYMYAEHIHWHNTGNPAITHLAGLQIDMDDMGTACASFTALDIYKDGSNTESGTGGGRECMIRTANGGPLVVKTAWLVEGNYKSLLEFSTNVSGNQLLFSGDVAANASYKVAVRISDLPGSDTYTTYYIPLYAS